MHNESMDHLMSDHLPEAKIGAIERYDHSPFEKLGETAYILRQKGRDDVGLFKIVGGAIDHQRKLFVGVVIKFVFQKPVAFLGIICRNLGDLFFLRVKIDVEVIGGQNLPRKIRILNLVLSEIVLPPGRS
jgi:hypothetical protein